MPCAFNLSAIDGPELPNFGREGYAPTDLDWIHKDRDRDADVHLRVFRAPEGGPRWNHWSIDWRVGSSTEGPMKAGQSAIRKLEIQQDPGHMHLTNWGPRTGMVDAMTAAAQDAFFLGRLSLAQRKKLECIAAEEPVRVPDGAWNCQQWLKNVLEKAVEADLLEEDTVTQAIDSAATVPNYKVSKAEHDAGNSRYIM
ncbi:hypothetical protein BD626DRAFT_546497 [Schizophyllum amplum]|uniref:Uncharacterized protein n=1 Tax=Schizophyllum amplum TaxID=97359 RepID=A0A550CN11_9AGAR|nr:hypothetical protein BD626DRAFT_546497 [Auriculariopsis ampla]